MNNDILMLLDTFAWSIRRHSCDTCAFIQANFDAHFAEDTQCKSSL